MGRRAVGGMGNGGRRVEFRVLGKLDALRDGDPVDLGAYRQRALLALLLTQPNTVLSTDAIIDALWGDDVATDRQNALWVYVSGLRKALEPDRAKRTDGTILLTRAPGYLVDVAPDALDSLRFERLLGEGRALVDTDPAAAALVLGEALALWRGRPFEEFTYESWAQPAIGRLNGLRLEAVEARIDADLLRGMSRELVSELESLVREHPLQEQLTGQLMLALYRSGRQADSLRCFQVLRARLGEELGIEPSPQIRKLEERIVTGDEELASAPRARVTGSEPQPGLAVRGYELRDRLGERGTGVLYRGFQPSVGREVAIKVIPAQLANDPAFIRRFEAEAQLVARLEHPHIVPLYDYWREPDAAYLVMRLMTGGALADLLERRALTAEETSRLVDQVGSALTTAHRHGIVHGQIDVANILIDDDRNAYLSDFAIVTDDDVEPAEDIRGLAAVVTRALTGLPGEVDQLRGGLAPSVLRVVDRAMSSDPGERHASIEVFVAELRLALGDTRDETLLDVDVANPYKGLRSFDAADANDFFGRERLVERLLARLGEPDRRHRFVAVVGPSGSGKSSVVKAGVLPAIRRQALPGRWFTVEMTPAPHPFEALEEALVRIAVDPPGTLLEELADGESGIRRAARRVLPDDGSRILLVIDQFEELYTQVDDDVASRFVDALVNAIADPHSRICVVVTLRADFYDRPLRHRGLGELLRDGTELITPMSPDELEQAITGPAARSDITFEPALVAELVRDVVDRAGALPLLQYALTELFESRRGNRITDAAYRELGGVSGALVQRAEGLHAGLGDQAREVARLVFLRLVTLGEGADDTRRRVLRSELEQLAVDRRFLDGVLDTFGRHRLLSFDRDPVTRGPTVEISHEALLTEWTRLRDWIDGARHDVRNQRRLASAMDEWIAAYRSDEYLLRGGRLQQLQGWAVTTSLPLSEPEREFLDASVAERDRAVDEEREREQRALDAERRERQRTRQVIAAGTVAALVAALAVFGAVQWRSAEDARAEAEAARADADAARAQTESINRAGSLVTRSGEALANDDPELALALAVASIRETVHTGYARVDALDFVHWSLQALDAQYDVGSDARIGVRPGPEGPTGVYNLSPSDLVEFAESVSERRLSDDECRPVYEGPCPARVEVPAPVIGYARGDFGNVGGSQPLEGTTVTLAGGFRDDAGFVRQLGAFTELTGIRIDQSGDALEASRLDDDLPDVALQTAPFNAEQMSEMIDIGAYLDPEQLRADFGDYLMSLGTLGADGQRPASDGTIRAIPYQIGVKGLVYYPKAAFDAAGYAVPETWDELVALSHQLVADGRTPWCFGFGSGPISGWPGTDLIESLVLRTGGTDVYDEWTYGRVGFSSPEVLEAGRLADQLIFSPGFVRNGPGSISTALYWDQLFPMLARDPSNGDPSPQCWLVTQSDILLPELPPDVELGADLDVFPLPSVDPGGSTPTMGGAFYAGAFADRPEVRAFIEYMTRPEWGEAWVADVVPGRFVSPNRRFDPAMYHDGQIAGAAELQRKLHDVLHTALEAGVFRNDASDLMPPAIGGFDEDFALGAFWQGMVDWVDGVRTIDEVFADIDAAWAALRAAGSGES